MSKFLPQRSDINPRWFKLWGDTFSAPDLALRISENDRLFDRVRNRMFEAMGMDIHADLNEQDILVAHAYVNDRQRLKQLCGMVLHGQILRGSIGKSDFEQLAKHFDTEDLRIAVSLREFHLDSDNLGVDISKFAQLAERSGAACIAAWKTSLDEQMGMRIHLMEDDDISEDAIEHEIGTDLARQIVAAVSQLLLEEGASLAA